MRGWEGGGRSQRWEKKCAAEGWGAEGWEAQKFALFFPLQISSFLLPVWSSRGLGLSLSPTPQHTSQTLKTSPLSLPSPNVTPQHERNVHARWDSGTFSQGCAQLFCSKRVHCAFCLPPHLLFALRSFHPSLTVMSRGPSRVPFSADGVFARCLASLPTPLVLALRESELDVAATLRDYLRMNALELQALLTEEGYTCEQDSSGLVAPSGAASSTHSPLAHGNNYLYDQSNGWVRRAATQEPTTRPRKRAATQGPTTRPLQRAATLKPTMRPLYERAATPKPTLRSWVLVHPLSTAILLPQGEAGIPNCHIFSPGPAWFCLVRGPGTS